jgi:carboxylesterase type B
MMLAHNFDEARMFLADWVKTEEDFTEFVGYAFPGDALAKLRDDIEKQYPSATFDGDQQARMRLVLRDSTFVCNNYQIYTAYKSSSEIYASRYEIPPAQHGSELMLLVWNQEAKASDIIKGMAPKIPDWLANILEVVFVPVARRYQTFFAGHALIGDPNYLAGGRINWEVTTDDGEELTNAMRIALQFTNPPFYRLGSDPQVSKKNCEFWDTAAQKISDALKKGSVNREKKPVTFKTQDSESLLVAAQIEL